MLSAVGCSNDSAPPDAIVPECCLETEEHLTIGEEYDSPHAFIFGDPAFIVTDAHGNIVIGDKLRMDIRVFDASGKLLRENAVRGAGPGEFYDFTSAGATDNGRLVVSDQINARVTGLSPDLREVFSLGLDPNEVLWPRAIVPLDDKFVLLFRLPPESEGDGCLIHLYDADFRSRVDCIAYADELLNTDDRFADLLTLVDVGRLWKVSLDTLLFAPPQYEGSFYRIVRDEHSWASREVSNGTRGIVAFESFERDPPENAVRITGRYRAAGVIFYRTGGAFSLDDGRTVHFVNKNLNGAWKLVAGIYDDKDDFLGYWDLGFDEATSRPHTVMWKDAEDRFYLVDRAQHPFIRVFSFSGPPTNN